MATEIDETTWDEASRDDQRGLIALWKMGKTDALLEDVNDGVLEKIKREQLEEEKEQRNNSKVMVTSGYNFEGYRI